MSQVSFYTGVADRLAFACRLLRKAHQSGGRILVLGSGHALARLDADLWRFEATEFIPHYWVQDETQCDAVLLDASPIVLAERAPAGWRADMLLNLGLEMPPDCDGFDRVLEIVSTDAEQVQAGRRRFKMYRDMGHAVTHYEANA